MTCFVGAQRPPLGAPHRASRAGSLTAVSGTAGEARRGDVSDQSDSKLSKGGWTDAERWQVYLAVAGLIVAVIAAVGQFM